MTEHAIIEADFATWRPVQGRKVLQLILEVPIERTHEVLQKLGAPIAGQSKWVAIALLKDRPEPSSSEPKVSGSPKRKFSDMPYSSQSAMRCEEPTFHAFMRDRHGETLSLVPDVASAVRRLCGITSRRELDKEEPGYLPRQWWEQLESEYQSYLTDQRFAGARR